MKGEKTSNAIEIISRRYVKDDPNRKAALEREEMKIYAVFGMEGRWLHQICAGSEEVTGSRKG